MALGTLAFGRFSHGDGALRALFVFGFATWLRAAVTEKLLYDMCLLHSIDCWLTGKVIGNQIQFPFIQFPLIVYFCFHSQCQHFSFVATEAD